MLKPSLNKPSGKTDWARIATMSDEERLAGARADPDAPARALLTATVNDLVRIRAYQLPEQFGEYALRVGPPIRVPPSPGMP